MEEVIRIPRNFEANETHTHTDAHSSGVAWGAVAGGAFVMAAVCLIMMALGAGFGLSAISPWSRTPTAATLGTSAIVWMILMQVVAGALGGYLVGRLRTKWVSVHTHEVYFRDTANGLTAWAVGFVLSAAFLASSATTMLGEAVRAEPSNAQVAGSVTDPNSYFTDELFRSDSTHPKVDAAVTAEAGRILAHSLFAAEATPGDTAYLTQLVAARTGLTPTEANNRVNQVIADARQTADAARQVAARLLLWTFLSLLIGAFTASYAATIGGRIRDHVPAM